MFNTTDTSDHLVIGLNENTGGSELFLSLGSNPVQGGLPADLTALYEYLDQKLSKEEAALACSAEKEGDVMPCLRLSKKRSKTNSTFRGKEGYHFCSLCRMRRLA